MTSDAREARSVGQSSVAVLLSAPSERFIIDICALLLQEFPRVGGPAFEHAVAGLRSRFAHNAAAVLTGLMLMLSAMAGAGHLPRLRSSRSRRAGKDDLLLVAMLAASQKGDKGRAIEAAIALLDTCRVHSVVIAARALGKLLIELGVEFRPVGATTFDYVAGYPVVADPSAKPAPKPAATAPTGRPVLRLLKSA